MTFSQIHSWRILQVAFPELSSILPMIHAIQFQTIGMSLSLKYTNGSIKGINFTFLLQDFRFRFCEQMISLFFKNLSRSFFRIREPDEWFPFSLNRLMRKCRLCRKMCLDSTFFHVRTLLQVSLHLFGSEMNWTLSFLDETDELVIGRHLLLSPVSTALKPAYSVFAHRPNPIQEGESQCSQLTHKSTSYSVCGRTSV